MPVRLLLANGGERFIEKADAARVDEPFFLVTRWHADIRQLETVLTLLAKDVAAAEIIKNGVRTDCVVVNGTSSADGNAAT
jgi:hypothetical protein